MNFKFNVGDRVRILDGRNIANYTGYWTNSMSPYVGNIVTIVDRFTSCGLPAYKVEGRGYTWDERGLELANRISEIKTVIFNDPATIVIWSDDSKTVVKCQPGDTYSKELGLAMCISKKFLGNKGNFNEEFKKWIPEESSEEISVKEMRKRLRAYCGSRECDGTCALEYRECDFLHMGGDDIREAYEIIFENKED